MRKRRFHKRRGGPPRSPLYRVPAGRRTVRLGVAADERGPSGWLLRAVERAAGLPFVSLCAIVQLPGVQLPGVQLPGIRSPGIRSTGDEQGDDAGALDERVAAETLGVPVLCAERDARAIARDIDLLVVPDDLPLPQTLLGIRALEVWRISSRDARLPLDALFEACRLTEVRVEVLRPGEPEPVYRAVIRTDLSIRPGLYRRQARLAMLPALARALCHRPVATSTVGELDAVCDGLSLPRRSVLSLAGNVRDLARSHDWHLAWRRSEAASLPGIGGDSSSPFALVHLPTGGSAADPFLVERDGLRHLFYEHVPQGARKGELACGTIDEEGRLHDCRTIMSRDVHLSYPFVFAWDGEYWMIPESSEARAVSLYRATVFPHAWTLEKPLLHGYPMVDATLHQQDGLWYMFVTIDETAGGAEEALFLFMAETPLGPFEPHPANPIHTDVRDMRSAGRMVRADGRLYRPAQDGSRGYGSALALQEVLALSPDRYAERRAGSFRPSGFRGLTGCHSLACAGPLQVIDLRLRRWLRPPG